MKWLRLYCEDAERTDQLATNPRHVELLAAGLFGEAGSILAELKKKGRETEAYPFFRERLDEEIGDLLWYFARLTTVLAPSIVEGLDDFAGEEAPAAKNGLGEALALGAAAGDLLGSLQQGQSNDVAARLVAVWRALGRIAVTFRVDLRRAAEKNCEKTRSRWPEEAQFRRLFDDDDTIPDEERIPRMLRVEFKEIDRRGKSVVILRCNGLNLGDRLTDNIEDEDFYRFHDVFHFAHAVYLGWSPILRGLLKCKRKSDPEADENQDGARAGIIEEAVAATVFNRAKEMRYYEGVDRVDYELLKTVTELVRGYEVDDVPLWQWEVMILNGYRVFRELRKYRGGKVSLDLLNRNLSYEAPSRANGREGDGAAGSCRAHRGLRGTTCRCVR